MWHQEIESFLKSIGLRQSTMEPNPYMSSTVLLLLYVDDILLAYKSLKDILSVKAKLKERYRMTDLGPVWRFLGLDIENHGSGYALHQATYIDTMLKRHGMQDAAEADSPIDRNVILEITKDDQDCPADHKEYLAVVGSLMYASLGGRPDISYAVALLSRLNIDPRTRHLMAAKCVLRYLKRTKCLRLVYTSGDLHGYVDADHANGKSKKSVGGYIFLLDGAAIS